MIKEKKEQKSMEVFHIVLENIELTDAGSLGKSISKKEGEKIIFNAVKYSGAGSPKLSVYTYRENEEGKKKKKKFKRS